MTVVPSESDLIFARPLWFWGLALLPLFAALFFYAERQRRIGLNRLIAARLQPRLAGTVSVQRRRVGFAILLLGLAGVVLALARPQWGFTWQETKRQGRDLILAIDTSRSMLATDLQPNRLTRAKLAALDLIAQLEGDRVGLIAFAGTAFLQAPLTVDYGAMRDTLNELDTEVIPEGGTNLAAAIEQAAEAFGKGESSHRALILFTDGEDLQADAMEAVKKNQDKFRIYTVGLGSADGSLIPVPGERGGTEFVKGEDGQYVKSHLDEARLREIAEASGGFYVHLQTGPAEMQQIVRDGLGKMTTQDIDSRLSRQPIERYQWPLALGMLAVVISLLLGERRRAVARALAILLLAGTPLAQAKSVGMERYAQKDFKGAMEALEKEAETNKAPEIQYDLGCAAYEAGEYDKAAKAFSAALAHGKTGLQAKASYNLGNTLAARGTKQTEKPAKLQEWENASQHFQNALRIDPKNEDARHNLDVAKKVIEALKKEDDKKDDQKKDDQKKDDEKKDDQKKDDQKKEDQKGDDKKDQQDKKDEEKKDEQGKDGEKKDQEKKDGKDQKDQSGQPDEKKDEQKGDQQNQAKDQKGEGDKKEEQQQPSKPEEKKEGDLKSAQEQKPGEPGEDKQDPASEAAEAQAAAKEGRMTEQDARSLLDSLQRVDRRVRLMEVPQDQRERRMNQPRKNW